MRDLSDTKSTGSEWSDRCEHWSDELARETPKRLRRQRRASPLILTGHGLSIRVEKGTLLVRDGLTRYPQDKRVHRYFKGALDAPQRIVVVDGSGEITLDALDWMAAQGVALIRLAWDGRATAAMSPDGHAADLDAVLWQRATRADAAARLAFACDLIAAKLDASLATLRAHVPPSPRRERAIAEAEDVSAALADDPPATLADLLGREGRAAQAYFRAWRDMPVTWTDTKRRPTPEAWRRYDTRTSLATGVKAKNRAASHPVNAMLNYAYGVLEAQLKIAAVAHGYDPTCGIVHEPYRGRASFVFDLMEPERPRVDAAVLAFVRETRFTGADFTLRDDGVVRLNPELARRIVQLTPDPRPVAPLARRSL